MAAAKFRLGNLTGHPRLQRHPANGCYGGRDAHPADSLARLLAQKGRRCKRMHPRLRLNNQLKIALIPLRS
jgi:hypothetical protein